MRIAANIDVFLNPELLAVGKVDKQMAMAMISQAIDNALADLGEIIHTSNVTVEVSQEGKDAAN